ncbi:thiopeptide-type bacteriocin biosynthesis protein [Chitinophaga sp. S165]|uniref:thiopeptide-type bacteriocin biosynthesis protein n=1 Tax=Chitinophaga sp. S165 TaxID=2135462 RepID=UPI000D7107B4|nr:thiopeptide-type bacteriocin biosynthesis protein [Chitinophaga sp. S165]PWV48831.1 thiopeptide-type bacteriocin biosynthesis protein [Chitinophaga sp. S165]
MQTKWLSAYLFSNKGLNKILCEQIVPFLQGADGHLQTSAPYFFIRYGEGGPHIRLRVKIREEDENMMRKMLGRYTPVQYTPYIPETERYGGPSAIVLAEQQFFLCSEHTLSLFSRPDWDNSKIFVQAIQMNMALLYALQSTPNETINICSQFIRSWLPRLYNGRSDIPGQEKYFLLLMEKKFEQYAPLLLPLSVNFWTTLQQEQSILQTYADRHIPLFGYYQRLINDTQKMRAIMCSLLHMQHNRLGIQNADEAYITFFTMKCMEHIYEQTN